jgi:hypothetical protein
MVCDESVSALDGDGDALLLAAGQFGGPLVGERGREQAGPFQVAGRLRPEVSNPGPLPGREGGQVGRDSLADDSPYRQPGVERHGRLLKDHLNVPVAAGFALLAGGEVTGA